MRESKKEKSDMRWDMIELPNIKKMKWDDYQPQISKINLPQTRKKTLNFEIMASAKLNRAMKYMLNRHVNKNTWSQLREM